MRSLERRLDALERLDARTRAPAAPTVRGVHLYCADADGVTVDDAVLCLLDDRRVWLSVDAFYECYPDGELIETYGPGVTP